MLTSCRVCVILKVSPETEDHTYEKVYYDATYHRSECTGCGRASTKSKHTYESYLGLVVNAVDVDIRYLSKTIIFTLIVIYIYLAC